MSNRVTKYFENLRPTFPDFLLKIVLALVILSVPTVPALVYSGILRITNIEFLNGMAWQPKYKAQSTNDLFKDNLTMRRPPEGTVPQGHLPYPYADLTTPQAKGKLDNPLPYTRENMLRGKRVYVSFCAACHGTQGQGDGPVSSATPGRLNGIGGILSLTTTKAIEYDDGQIYHILTVGQNEKMPALAEQIPPMDRWAVTQYVRVLQRFKNPQPGDEPFLSEFEDPAGDAPADAGDDMNQESDAE